MIRMFSFVLFMLLMIIPVGSVQAQTPQQTLTQYLSELQKKPDDNALRERIIRHAQTMRPVPAIPEEARRHYVMAKTLFDGAKKVEDFKTPLRSSRVLCSLLHGGLRLTATLVCRWRRHSDMTRLSST
jgi:hypothetical protein